MTTFRLNIPVHPDFEAAYGDLIFHHTGEPQLGTDERVLTSTSSFAQISYGLINYDTNLIVEITGTNLDDNSGQARIHSVRLLSQPVEETESPSGNTILTPTGASVLLYEIEGISFRASTDQINRSIGSDGVDYQLFVDLIDLDYDSADSIFLNQPSFLGWETGDHFVDFVHDDPAEFPVANDPDAFIFADENFAVAGDGNDTIMGSANRDNLYGGAGDDILVGLNGIDVLDGEAGNDLLRGGKGGDLLIGGNGDDTLFGARDADEVTGNRGDDLIRLGSGDDLGRGSRGADTLFGALGDDTLRGGGGDDRLTGGGGDDVLAGGGGADRFIFRGQVDDDVITDFNGAAGDRIDLRAFGYDGFEDLTADGNLTSENGNAVILLRSGSITLENVDAGALSEDDFIF